MTALTPWSLQLARMFCAVISLTLLPGYFAGGGGIVAAEAHRPFAAFDAKVEIDIEDGEIEVWASFTLGAGNNGLNLPTETVTIRLTGGTGAFSVTLPAGSFKRDKSGEFKFQGIINRVKLEASIRPLSGGAFEFEVETEGANLKGFANPVTVSLAIGEDSGSKTVRAKIE